MKDIRPIRDEADYDWALSEIEKYFDDEPKRGSPAADRFEVLLGLIDAYEAKHWDIEAPDPIEAIKLHMSQSGRTNSDLAELLGSRPRATEILKRRRALTMDMVRKLNRDWHIPAEVLIQPYHLEKQNGSRVS
ncbi:helix-turn-helix domain-containing protein [Tepidicaulis sp. LMO-SS28]|uniref:helix-turn-helix domain-containing protein n=1 Tax=Tepidicaulis sp. LMO-SS28 TaxID=3447455 RepID=UPI003EE3B364